MPGSFSDPAWTEAERRTLRESYSGGGIYAAREALPHRSEAAIYHRARRLGISRRRRWTEADDNQLRVLWDLAVPLTRIAKELGRGKAATYVRAQSLGLPLGCPDGYEHLSAAAKRTGYDAITLRRILAWAGVHTKVTLSRPVKASWRRRIVDPVEVDEAVAAWLRTETANGAAKRLGISADRLRYRLKKLGVRLSRERQVRLTEEQIRAANDLAVWGRRNGLAGKTGDALSQAFSWKPNTKVEG